MSKFQMIYDKIGYTFAQEELLEKALTHSSFNAENNYETLEFLGDSIVNYAVSKLLFTREGLTEGEMTKQRASLVSREPLASLSVKLGFVSESKSRNCKLSVKIKSDFYEAVTAAIAIDSNLDNAIDFVTRTIESADVTNSAIDYKSMLNEKCEKQGIDFAFKYQEQGPDNRKTFTAELFINGESKAIGVGSSKKSAEKVACKNALENW